jgi:hypothetical protein
LFLCCFLPSLPFPSFLHRHLFLFLPFSHPFLLSSFLYVFHP